MKNKDNNAIGFEWKFDNEKRIGLSDNPKKIPYIIKKMMPEYVWDLTAIEDNPYSFLEVQTLLGGQTIGGHSLFDQQQIINQKNSIEYLIEKNQEGEKKITKSLVLEVHAHVAKDEALTWGKFRDGQVGIGGTTHQPPPPELLEENFNFGLTKILGIKNPIERALVYYFWGSLNQFFYDGNKRTSRAVMNFILMSEGYYYLSVPGNKKESFNQMMVDFYETKNSTNGMNFMLECYKNWN